MLLINERESQKVVVLAFRAVKLTGKVLAKAIKAYLDSIENAPEKHGQMKLKGGIPMAGRKPKPTAPKKLEGNPGKRKLNTKEPVPEKGMPDCPKWLLPEAKEEWRRLCQKLADIL